MRLGRWAAALLVGCGGPAGDGGTPAGGALYAGCALVAPDGLCWAPGGEVVVWAVGEVAVDGVAVAGRAVDGGVRVTVEVADRAVVTVEGRPALRVARELDGVGACPATSPVGAAWCLRLEAKAAMAEGAPDAAATRFDEAAAAFLAAGWTGEAALQADRAAWVRAQVQPAPPREERVAPAAPAAGEATAWLMAARRDELALRQAGLLREALDLQRAVVRVEARVGTPAGWTESRLVEAGLELAIGEAAAAREVLAEVIAAEDGATCDSADRLSHAVWQVGMAWWSGADEAGPLLAAAAPKLDAVPACDGRGREADRAVDRALVRLALGDADGAAAALAQVAGAEMRDTTRLWWHLLRGEVAWAGGDADTALEAAAQAARVVGLAEARWLAADLEAAAWALRGDAGRADAAWERGEAALGELAALTPVLGGRAAFLDQRAVAVGRHVDSLVARGRLREAFEVGRAWRRAAAVGAWAATRVAGLDTGGQAAWRDDLDRLEARRRRRAELEVALRGVPASEAAATEAALAEARAAELVELDSAVGRLGGGADGAGRPRGPGEVQLLVVPAGGRGARGWRALWQDDAGWRTAGPWSEAALRADPAALLVGARWAGVGSVTLLLPAALEDLPLHLAPADGVPLIVRAPVRWSVDLGPPDEDAAPRRAVVLGDPEGGLAGARAEAEAAEVALRADGVEVVSLGFETTRDALADALAGPAVGWLQVAAHGEVGGAGPRLRLGAGTTWTAGDALAMGSAPRQVLLTGCHGAVAGGGSLAGQGLAHAFVRGGAEAVVAPWGEVDDAATARLAASVLAARPLDIGLESAFREAARAAIAASRADEVRAWRVVTR